MKFPEIKEECFAERLGDGCTFYVIRCKFLFFVMLIRWLAERHLFREAVRNRKYAGSRFFTLVQNDRLEDQGVSR